MKYGGATKIIALMKIVIENNVDLYKTNLWC